MINLYTKNINGIWFGVAYSGEKVFATAFSFNEENANRSLLNSVPFNVPFQFIESSEFAEQVLNLIKKVYDGKGITGHVSLATEHLSSYTKKIIQTVSLIPLGYATSYGSVANAAGGSPRAVGRVMAMNPFAPIVPCHRVVSSDFTLGGYGGGYGSGLAVKLAFLKRERQGYTTKREIPVDGKKLQVFPVEFVLREAEKRKE